MPVGLLLVRRRFIYKRMAFNERESSAGFLDGHLLCRVSGSPLPGNPSVGVWQIQLIENITASGSSINNSPQPSLAIFTGSHYSLIWMPGTTWMRAFKQRWLPTDKKRSNGMVRSCERRHAHAERLDDHPSAGGFARP